MKDVLCLKLWFMVRNTAGHFSSLLEKNVTNRMQNNSTYCTYESTEVETVKQKFMYFHHLFCPLIEQTNGRTLKAELQAKS